MYAFIYDWYIENTATLSLVIRSQLTAVSMYRIMGYFPYRCKFYPMVNP